MNLMFPQVKMMFNFYFTVNSLQYRLKDKFKRMSIDNIGAHSFYLSLGEKGKFETKNVFMLLGENKIKWRKICCFGKRSGNQKMAKGNPALNTE